MALDRTWFNTLVDDDGSGVTGSVWDKADVDSLMDVIDAEFARLIQAGSWAPYVFSSGGGSALYSIQSGRWARSGNVVQLAGHVALSSKGSLGAGNLVIGGFPFAGTVGCAQAGVIGASYANLAINVTGIASYLDGGGGQMNLTYGPPEGQTGAPTLQVAHINPTFALVFGGSYVVD